MATNITEIIPDDLPEWAKEAFDDGQFFKVVCERIKQLEQPTKEMTLAFTQTAADRHQVISCDCFRHAHKAMMEVANRKAGRYQSREIGESDWLDCDRARYEYCALSPEHDTRILTD